ncbi:hypothetical protein HED60_20175 [Planctomycetales bacterium ZRK34]|nr:hypothetical protein HED60_20175 [Planctomycetales bacterium ZRK34]
MSRYRMMAVLVLVLSAAFLIAGEVDQRDFQTVKAKAATVRFDQAIKQADALHQRTIAEARRQYMADLNEAMVEATKAGNLEEAIRLRDAMREIQESKVARPDNEIPSGRETLTKSLIGSTWLTNNGTDKVQYQADGTGTENGKSAFKWAALDDQRVVWYWINSSYVTLLVFDQNATRCTFYGLDQTDKRKNRPTKIGTRVK